MVFSNTMKNQMCGLPLSLSGKFTTFFVVCSACVLHFYHDRVVSLFGNRGQDVANSKSLTRDSSCTERERDEKVIFQPTRSLGFQA